MANRIYPDQARIARRGCGFSNMGDIILDFVSYNRRVVSDFSSLLNRGLSISQRELIQCVADESALRGLALYAVGGLPRDLWMGHEVSDLDLVVEGNAIELAGTLAAKYGGSITAHSRFGTAKWDLRGTRFGLDCDKDTLASAFRGRCHLDLISARSEVYHRPAALPRIKLGRISDDLRRRDFTINTLAIRLDEAHFGELRDDFGATKDLQQGIIRVLHSDSFRDDPTRMYRAVRYEQRFGFKIAGDTLALIPPARGLVESLSGPRIRHELDLILDEDRAVSMLTRLGKLGLLKPIHRALPAGQAAIGRVRLAAQSPPFPVRNWSRRNAAWLMWLMALSERQILLLGKRLHQGNAIQKELIALVGLSRSLKSIRRGQPSTWVAHLDGQAALTVYVAYLAARRGQRKRMLYRYLAEWRHVRPTMTGHDLHRIGLAPGPEYRRILGRLRDAWLDGLVTSQEEERRFLMKILHKK